MKLLDFVKDSKKAQFFIHIPTLPTMSVALPIYIDIQQYFHAICGR